MIKESTGLNSEITSQSDIRVSGSLENHYAPKAQVLLDVDPKPGDGFIALSSIETPPGAIRLAAPASIEEFSRTLYAALREGDYRKLPSIVVIQPSDDGIAVAIRDRLKRSAKSH